MIRFSSTLMLLIAGSTALAFGQQVTDNQLADSQTKYNDSRPKADQVQRLPSVTVDLKDVSREAALERIAKAAGYELMFSRSVVRLSGKVTLRLDKVPLDSALREVLRGTGITSEISPSAKSVRLSPSNSPVHQQHEAQQQGTIRGQVVDSATGNPVAGALIGIAGTNKRVLTDADGNYVLPGVSTGTHSLYARRLGYHGVNRAIAIREGQDTTVNFALAGTASVLTEVVTTGAGERQRVQVGQAIETIQADSIVAKQPIQNLSDLLSRAKGLDRIIGTGAVGSASRLRMRGSSSMNADNTPIIIIDGVRMSTEYSECRNLPGGSNFSNCEDTPSRIDDIDPNNIESIDVLRGPSASALYGSEAANGVIIIKTKSGQAGPARWVVRADQGYSHATTDLYVPVQGLGTAPNGDALKPCNLFDQSQGLCIPVTDTVLGGFNRFANPRTTSMATGRRSVAGVEVSGGSNSVRYIFSGAYEYALGTAKLPDVDAKLFREARGQDLPGWMKRPNSQTRTNVNGRMTGQFSKNSDYSLGVQFVQLFHRLGADGLSDNGATDLRDVADTFTVSRSWTRAAAERKQNLSRVIGSATVNWRPAEWLSGKGTYGRDFSLREDATINRRNWCLPACTPTSADALGALATGSIRDVVQTFDATGTISYPLRPGIVFRTVIGGQYTQKDLSGFSASARELPLGKIDYNSATGTKTISQSTNERVTVGTFLDQSVSFNDRIFLNAALRRDLGSALGAEVAPLFPKWSLSYLISEEPYFPQRLRDLGVTLRLRTAFGNAGTQPGSTDRLRSFTQSQSVVNPDGSYGGTAIVISRLGNENLSPERSVEREGGFELGLWDERLSFDVTFFHKMTEDALVDRPLPPSLGMSSIGTQVVNLGRVRSTGSEILMNARVIERHLVRWTLGVGYASHQNKVVKLGRGVRPFAADVSNWEDGNEVNAFVMEGYPIFSRWAKPILGFSDVNNDGIIAPSEIVMGDSLVFIGSSDPKFSLKIDQNLGLWNDRFTVSAVMEYNHGLTQYNSYAASNTFYSLRGYRRDQPLQAQACAVAKIQLRSNYCFYETINYLRLKSLSFGYTAPTSFARRLKAQSMAISLHGSDLGVWSGFTGKDPGVNTSSAAGNAIIGGAAVPPPMQWTLRVRLTY